MSAVAENGGGIVRPETRPFGEVAKGYTFFAEGDVIFAKITPCMQNGKHAIAGNLLDGFGFGSTEFHVFRPRDEIISEWILNFLLQPKVLTEATRHFTGAVGQQRVPENVLANMEIALPPKDEQRRIAARLREQMAAVERARAAVQGQLDAAQSLPAALLRAIFTSHAAQRWPRRCLGDMLETRNDIIHPRNRPTGTATFVGLEHIEPNTGRQIGSIEIDKAEMTERKAQFFKGDIVYGYLRPYLNKVWIAEFDGLCSVDQYVYQVNSELAVTSFVAWFMRSSTYLERAPIGGSPGQLPRIRMEEVAATEINLPPRAEQQKIAARLDAELTAARALVETLATRLAEIELLPAALLRSAFAGQA
jgi:type I restriction enzyme S subunit